MSQTYPPSEHPVSSQQFQQFLADLAKIVARMESMDKNIESIAESLAKIEHQYASEPRRA